MGNTLNLHESRERKIDGTGQGCAYSISRLFFPYSTPRISYADPKDPGNLV